MSSLITLQREWSQCKDIQATQWAAQAVTKSMGKRGSLHSSPFQPLGASDSSTMAFTV